MWLNGTIQTTVKPLQFGQLWDSLGSVLFREVPLFQRLFCTHLYVAGTVGNFLIREVSLFQRYVVLVPTESTDKKFSNVATASPVRRSSLL